MPEVKFQPHGHLVLAREEDMPSLEQAHQVQKAVGAQTAIISKVRERELSAQTAIISKAGERELAAQTAIIS